MVPQSSVNMNMTVKRVRYPTFTYRMELSDPNDELAGIVRPRTRISKNTDDLPAMVQAVYKILRTERYRFAIYDWNYGIELDDLLGKPKPFAKAEIPRRIREALLADERISAVDGFIFPENKNDAGRYTTVSVHFIVHTRRGSFSSSLDVLI